MENSLERHEDELLRSPNKDEDEENSLERYEDELMQGQLNEEVSLKSDEEPELSVDKKKDVEDESESHANEPVVIQESLYDTALEVSTTEEAAFKTVNEPATEEEELLDIVDEQISPEVELKLQTEAVSDVASGNKNDLTPEDVVIVPKVTDNVDEPTKNEPVSSPLPP